MLFYDSVGPNPRVPRIFFAEKGVEIPRTTIDLRGGENRREPYLAKNPVGQMPALELDDGTVLTEITAICEYIEEQHPSPPLIGTTAEERAETRMWTRRIDLNIIEPMVNGFRFAEGLKLFQKRIHCIPQAADDLKATARKNLAWLDRQLEGRPFVCGERVTLADIMLLAFLEFGANVGQKPDESLRNVNGIVERMKSRPSAVA
jgi:glutathione S-transferase